MESEGNYLFSSTMFVGIFVAAIILLLTYILKLFNNDQKVEDQQKNEKSAQHSEKKKETVSKTKKKVSETKWGSKADKQGFTHPWLIKSLKGHTGEVLDMDFSSNNKYLISCADEDPGGSTESSTSSVESAKDSSRPPSVEPSPKAKGLSRRQRKNRRKEDASPETKRRTKKKPPTKTAIKKQMASTPLRMWSKLKMDESQLYTLLENFLLERGTMYTMGYPISMNKKSGQVVIFKMSHRPRHVNSKFDVNAKEFVPKSYKNREDYDSGQGSGNSSDSGENADDLDTLFETRSKPVVLGVNYRLTQAVQITTRGAFQFQLPVHPPPGTKMEPTSVDFIDRNDGSALLLLTAICVPDITPESESSSDSDTAQNDRKHTCVRCHGSFYTRKYEYISKDSCSYHWGKLHKSYLGHSSQYTCCQLPGGSPGCSESRYHVWNGLEDGTNHFTGYVQTKPKKSSPLDGNYGIYALDCEMSYTVAGLELTKVTVVGVDGHIVYDSYVKTEQDVLDYNTRFSGITSKDLVNAKTLKEVQNDLMGFINADTILIGHGLENDLRALKMVHERVIDSSHSFPHHLGLPFRRSLKQLAWYVLKRDIQHGQHDSYEDAIISMELILSLVRKNNCI